MKAPSRPDPEAGLPSRFAVAEVVPADLLAGDPRAHRVEHDLLGAKAAELEKERLRGDVGAPTFFLNRRRKLGDRERLGDRDSGLPDRVRDLLVGVAVAILERDVSVRFLERRQVLPLEVLDERDLEELAVGDVHLDARQLRKAGLDGGPVTPLAGDDRESSVLRRADEDRLEDAVVRD